MGDRFESERGDMYYPHKPNAQRGTPYTIPKSVTGTIIFFPPKLYGYLSVQNHLKIGIKTANLSKNGDAVPRILESLGRTMAQV